MPSRPAAALISYTCCQGNRFWTWVGWVGGVRHGAAPGGACLVPTRRLGTPPTFDTCSALREQHPLRLDFDMYGPCRGGRIGVPRVILYRINNNRCTELHS